MAFEDVPEVPYAQFLKLAQVFGKVGDKFAGIYKSANEGQYGLDVVFDSSIGDVSLTLKGGLRKQIESSDLTGGECVLIQFKATKDVGKDSPMKLFKVMVDREWKGKPVPPNGPNVKPPERAAAPADDSDLPF